MHIGHAIKINVYRVVNIKICYIRWCSELWCYSPGKTVKFWHLYLSELGHSKHSKCTSNTSRKKNSNNIKISKYIYRESIFFKQNIYSISIWFFNQNFAVFFMSYIYSWLSLIESVWVACIIFFFHISHVLFPTTLYSYTNVS